MRMIAPMILSKKLFGHVSRPCRHNKSEFNSLLLLSSLHTHWTFHCIMCFHWYTHSTFHYVMCFFHMCSENFVTCDALSFCWALSTLHKQQTVWAVQTWWYTHNASQEFYVLSLLVHSIPARAKRRKENVHPCTTGSWYAFGAICRQKSRPRSNPINVRELLNSSGSGNSGGSNPNKRSLQAVCRQAKIKFGCHAYKLLSIPANYWEKARGLRWWVAWPTLAI